MGRERKINERWYSLTTGILLVTVVGCLQGNEALVASSFPVFYDSSNNMHRDIQYHPEQPARIDACVQALKEYCVENSIVDLVDVASETSTAPATTETGTAATSMDNKLIRHDPFSFEELDHAREMLVAAHSEEYVSQFERRCRDSRQRRIDEGRTPLGFVGYVDDDTFLTTESYDVCLRATACWIRAVECSLKKEKMTTASLALTRPPGHHATQRLSNGFCIFNFCAAAALHAVTQNPDIKVSILDWDVHYGQGVADICKGHDRIRYASIHQTPAFPYMGEKCEVHDGNILTVPIRAESTWTCGYKDVLEQKALPFLLDESSWQPDLVIVSAGYDALDSDELASVSLTAPDYGKAAQLLIERMNTVHQINKKPGLVFGLEGGYQLKEMAAGGNLQDAVVQTVKAVVEGGC